MRTSSAFRATSFSLLLLLSIVIAGCAGSSQTGSLRCFYDYVASRTSLPQFEARFFCTPDSLGERLDVYVSVKESRLKYARSGGAFFATYTSGIEILSDNKSVADRQVTRSVRRDEYPGDLDETYDAFLLSFHLNPGEYSVVINLDDSLSRGTSVETYAVTLPNDSGRTVSLSDILLLVRYDTLGEGRRITPFILSNAGLLPDTIRFFTVASSARPSADSIYFTLYRLQGRNGYLPNYALQAYSRLPSSYDPCGESKDSIMIYRYGVEARLIKGNSYIFGLVPKPSVGDYVLKVELKENGHDSASVSLGFRVRDKNFPEAADNLGEMVGSLNYIATGPEMKEIVEAKTDSGLRANLLGFWKTHGGFGKMAQYYKRVTQANRLFTSCVEGWRTPMGMFYIVCGPPDFVECEGEWNERWTYSISNGQSALMAIFRLVRETANVEDRVYRLENIYSNADLWSYYITQWRTPG